MEWRVWHVRKVAEKTKGYESPPLHQVFHERRRLIPTPIRDHTAEQNKAVVCSQLTVSRQAELIDEDV